MSVVTLRRDMAEPMLRALSTEANNAVRKQAQQTGRAQLLQLPDLEFINDTIRSLIESDSDKANRNLKTVNFSDENIQTAKELASRKQKAFLNKRKIQHVTESVEWQYLQANRPDLAAMVLFEQAYFVNSFNVLRSLKKQIVRNTVKKSQGILARIYSKIDRGHGAMGGDAISHLSIASAQAAGAEQGVDLGKIPGFEEHLVNTFNENEIDISTVEIIKKLTIEYDQLVTPTGLKDTYIPVITFQDFLANRGVDARTEKVILDSIRTFVEKKIGSDIINMEGSPSMKDRIKDKIVSDIAGKRKVNGKKVKAPKTKKKPSADAKGKNKSGGSITNRKAKRPPVQRTRAKKSNVNIGLLLGLLNNQLPNVVAKNMGDPRLNNVTGRFASSVRATDVMVTPQGFPSIGYTYRKNPYQTFEVGYKQGSEDLDPRRLIDASIREIAASMAIGRLYTRRV